MVGKRDSQKERVYSAERRAFGDGTAMSFDECVAYLRDIRARSWYRTRWGMRGASTVVKSNGYGGSAVGSGEIRLGEWARRDYVVLHELAHTLVAAEVDRYSIAGHGPEFAGVYLFLVGKVMGREKAAALRAAYRHHRVRYTNSAIPPVRFRDATVTAQRAQRSAAQREPLTDRERQSLVRLLDRAVQSGEAGAVGTVARRRALALRREIASRVTAAAAPPPRHGRRGVNI